jgi:hypothetical protein
VIIIQKLSSIRVWTWLPIGYANIAVTADLAKTFFIRAVGHGRIRNGVRTWLVIVYANILVTADLA